MSLHEAFYTLPIKEWFMRKVRHRKKNSYQPSDIKFGALLLKPSFAEIQNRPSRSFQPIKEQINKTKRYACGRISLAGGDASVTTDVCLCARRDANCKQRGVVGNCLKS